MVNKLKIGLRFDGKVTLKWQFDDLFQVIG
jgi:hypothetical protein